MRQYAIYLITLLLAVSGSVVGKSSAVRSDRSADMKIINDLIDVYNQTEDECDFEGQAKIMSKDRIIRFYGNGTVAIASFYWLRAVYLPANTPEEIAKRYPHPDPRAVTLVFEKQNGQWKIVHTHMSLLYPVKGAGH